MITQFRQFQSTSFSLPLPKQGGYESLGPACFCVAAALRKTRKRLRSCLATQDCFANPHLKQFSFFVSRYCHSVILYKKKSKRRLRRTPRAVFAFCVRPEHDAFAALDHFWQVATPQCCPCAACGNSSSSHLIHSCATYHHQAESINAQLTPPIKNERKLRSFQIPRTNSISFYMSRTSLFSLPQNRFDVGVCYAVLC